MAGIATTVSPSTSRLQRDLSQTMRHLFLAQGREILHRYPLSRVAGGETPNLRHWVKETVKYTEPIFLRLWQQGMMESHYRTSILRQVPSISASPWFPGQTKLPTSQVFLPSQRKQQRGSVAPLLTNFDLFNPYILDAVNEASFQFARSTLETATTDLQTAFARLRDALKRRLSHGEATTILAQEIARIFADPDRANRIAVTETSRMVHGGGLLAAKRNPFIKGKQWLTSSDACEQCLDLDGLIVGLDEPFIVLSKGGPYATVLHPPLHPYCMCTWTEVLA